MRRETIAIFVLALGVALVLGGLILFFYFFPKAAIICGMFVAAYVCWDVWNGLT